MAHLTISIYIPDATLLQALRQANPKLSDSAIFVKAACDWLNRYQNGITGPLNDRGTVNGMPTSEIINK